MKMPLHVVLLTPAIYIASINCNAEEIQVGPEKQFQQLESALKSAKEGDTILVHPLPKDEPYSKVALYISTANITIRAITPQKRITLSGSGFDYSGRGSAPRAIVQFNKGADNCRLEGFKLSGAHNRSHNGAGVRINQANGVTISNCEIHSNDMGIMSNGDGTAATGAEQLITNCIIHSNGNLKDPGYNHNLYLGGESVTLKDCEVHSSLTGHNVKSRAHRTVIRSCYIHDSSNREIDLVDHKNDTTRPESDAIILDCIIVKAPECRGNRGVIHFGQDIGGDRNGTLHLTDNIIVTPYISPVVYISAKGSGARICGNIICDGGVGQRNQVLVTHSKKITQPKPVPISDNWLSHGYPGSSAEKGENPPFSDPTKGDYSLKGGKEAFMNSLR